METSELTKAVVQLIPDFQKKFALPYTQMAKHVVTKSQLHILLFLEGGREISMSEVADWLEISRPQVTNVVDGLVQLGVVSRCSDPDDRRRVTISITGRGREFLQETERRTLQQLDKRFEVLTREEQEKLWEALCYVKEQLSKLG